MSEHEIHAPVNPEAGFDPGEPQANVIAIFGIVTVVMLVVVILSVQSYFDHAHEQQVYEKVMLPPSEELRSLHAREDGQLYSYQYIDRGKGTVRIPIARAMELLIKESAEGKVFYPTKAAPVRPETPTGPAPGQPATPAPAPAPAKAAK